MKKLSLVLLLAAAGCITLTPKARAVRVTDDPSSVAACTSLGGVRPSAPYLTRAEAIKQLKNLTAANGGDVLLLTSAGWATGDHGIEYDCSGEKKPKE